MTNSSPLPPSTAADHAQIIADAQQSLNDAARKLRAVAPNVANSATCTALLRLTDRVRRAALIAETVVQDLHNEARRGDLENDAPLPPDVSAAPSSSAVAIPDSPTTPLFLQDQPVG